MPSKFGKLSSGHRTGKLSIFIPSQRKAMPKNVQTTSSSSSSATEVNIVKGSIVVNKTEVNSFLEFPFFLYDPVNVGNLISGSSAFSKPSLDIWKSSVCIMLQPSMQDFKHDHTSMGDECNCPMVSTFFSTTLLGNWDED